MKKTRILAVFCAIVGVLMITLFLYYQYQLLPADKTSKANIEVIIPSGMTTDSIATILEKKGLIKSKTFFKVYLKLNHVTSLKASTYTLKKNMSLNKIVEQLEKGNTYNVNAVNLTFQEGKTITDYATLIESKTAISKAEFLAKMKDETYIRTLIDSYWFLTEDILNPDIYYPLEGYLAPDTYEFINQQVSIEEIVKKLLDQEEKNLEKNKQTLQAKNIHQTLTLASITELEGVTSSDRKKIVGVFQNRLAKGMNLGSDVTTYYAFQQTMDKDLASTMFNTYNPYNTRSEKMTGKLPVGPICNPSKESIEATLHPTASDNLYFVADKNGKVYYTKTQQEHNAKVKELKENGDWIW